MQKNLLNTEALPEKLDLNDWIQFSLDSAEETDRQIALEELATTGVPPYLTSRIREISAQDSSEVCRQLALWIESLERSRTELKPQLKKLELSPINIIMLLENAEPSAVVILTQMLRKAPAEEILDLWRHGLASEHNPKMLQIGLILLSKFGKEADAEIALRFLQHPDADVVCAAFSLLQNQNQELFKQHIRVGLSAKSFKIQLHSTHLLRAVDVDAALEYIQAYLFHKNPLIRQKALRELMLVPFDRAGALFLQYLSREVQLLLLVKAGFVIAFNPLPDFPVKIFDIFQFSRDAKKHILQLVLKQLLESIQSAGILKQTFEEYMADLKQKINLKKSELVIRCALKDLTSFDRNMRLSAVDRLAPFVEFPSIAQALTKHLQQEADAEVRAAIEAFVTPKPAHEVEIPRQAAGIEPEKAASAIDMQAFLQLGFKEQRKLLKAIADDQAWHDNRNILSKLLKEHGLKKNVILELIKIFSIFATRIDVDTVVPFLEDSDPSVVAAAIKALGKMDIDVMLPHLNRFLADEDPRIKASALDVYVLADKEGAVQYLASMLRSSALSTRRLGLSLLPQIDYSSAEPLIWRLLKYEGNNELKIQAAYMVAANPTTEGLYKLFAISHKKEGDLKEGFEELWNLALVSAESLFNRPRPDIERECWEAFKVDTEKAAEKRAYSYSNVVGEDELQTSAAEPEKGLAANIAAHFLEFKGYYLAGLIMVMPIIYFSSSGDEVTPRKSVRKNTASAAKNNFMPTERSMSTQVGSDGWQGTLKSGARELLSGPAYTAALKTSAKEVDDFRSNQERDLKQYYQDVINNSDEPEETKQMFEAHLHPAFSNAVKALENGNKSEAELYFERAVEDSQLNPVGKCYAFQRLMELSEEKHDKASWIKWQDLLMKELKKMPGYEGLEGLDGFGQTYIKMIEIGQHLKNGGDSAPIMNHLINSGESEAEARKSIEALHNIDSFFPKNH